MQTINHKLGTVEIYDDKFIVKKRGSLLYLKGAMEKTFPFSHIRAIEKHKARPLYDFAFIDIDLGGGGITQGGSLAENSVGFSSNEEMENAYSVMYAAFEKYCARQTNSSAKNSAADELLKYKQLLDMGVISANEFEKKKRELIG